MARQSYTTCKRFTKRELTAERDLPAGLTRWMQAHTLGRASKRCQARMNTRTVTTLLSALAVSLAATAAAQPVTATIDATSVGRPITRLVFGGFTVYEVELK